jgi:hypothetical protein
MLDDPEGIAALIQDFTEEVESRIATSAAG